MVGIVGNMSNRKGGIIIPSVVPSTDSTIEKMNFAITPGCKILCTNCTIEDESTLISNASIIKTTEGYHFNRNINVVVSRTVANKVPLTIIRGREILYADSVIRGTNSVFNLPKGARINGTIVNETGEFSIATPSNIIIEY